MKILQSNTLALLVIRNLGLSNQPGFAGKQQPSTGGVPDSASAAQTLEREDQLIGTFQSNLSVFPVPNTSIIEIKYSSPDPRLAAEVANVVANTFIEQNIKAKIRQHHAGRGLAIETVGRPAN